MAVDQRQHQDNFEIEDEGSEHIDEDGGIDIEYIVFQSPLGKIRLEHIAKPIVLDRKTTYSKRIGSETKVDYIYSETERSYQLDAYKWNEKTDAWEEIDGSSFA